MRGVRISWKFLGMSIAMGVIIIVSLGDQLRPVPGGFIEGSDMEERRQAWIDTLHRTAPGLDWREIDNQTRWEKYQAKLPQLRRSYPEGRLKTKKGGSETIADGVLTGEWIEKGSRNLAGRMHCVDIDFVNNRLYGASSGGNIWVSTIGQTDWTCLTDHKQVKDIQFLRVFENKSGETRIMMSPRNRFIFYYSDDMGITWETGDGLSSYSNGGYLIRGVSKPDGTIYLLAHRNGHNYLFRSTDLGYSFTRIARMDNGSIYADIWTSRFGEGSLYYIDRSKIYQLSDDDTLESVGTVGLSFSESEIKQLQLNGCVTDSVDFLYVMYRLDKSSRFFGSDNSGVSWTSRGSNHEGPFMTNSFGVSNVDPYLLGFGGVNAYSSRDGGRNWLAINSWGEYYGNMRNKLHADIPEIEFFLKPDGSEFVWISTDGGTYYSDDGLQTVENVSLENLNVSQYYSSYTNRDMPHVINVGAQDQGFQRTNEESEGVVNFTQTISGDYGHIVSADRGYSVWTVYPGFAMRYPDAVTGTRIVTWDFSGSNHFWMPPLMEDPYDPYKVYLAGGTSSTGNHLWLLEDVGSTISVIELPFDFSNGNQNHWISAMSYSPINKDYRYVLNSGGRFFFSSDRGTTWERSTSIGPGSHYFYGNTIVAHPRDINTLYIAGSHYSGNNVYVSYDGGVSFEGMSEGMPRTLVFEMKSNEDGSLLFAATEVGPYVYIRSENQWFDLAGISAPDQTYWSVDYVPAIKTARFGTYGRGIWDFRINSFTGRQEDRLVQEPLRVYPNPFNDELHINGPIQTGGYLVQLISITGQLVLSEKISQQNGILRISTRQIEPGVYILQVGEKDPTRIRVVKQ